MNHTSYRSLVVHHIPRFVALSIVVTVLGLLFSLFESGESTHVVGEEISGEVRDERGPLPGAIVRIKAGTDETMTDERGRFQLLNTSAWRHVTAWKDGYFIGGGTANANPLTIQLNRLPDGDCSRYLWVDPTPDPSHRMNCGNCHKAIHDEWRNSGHAKSATNRRFLNLYEGTDWHGKRDVGWNLLKEYPEGAGVCSSCHAPTQKSQPFAEFDIRDVQKEPRGLSGVHCDYCHKVRGPENGKFGLSHGRYQLQLLRPDPIATDNHQLFFGPLADVDRGDDVFSRFQRDSRLCAACHEGVVFGVPVYSTYSEWLESPASVSGASCQSCHMAPTGRMTNIAPGHGGIRRDPTNLGNHKFFDGSQLEMLRRSLKLETSARHTNEGVQVDVSFMAENVGHRVPTGFIDRQVLLFVEAFAGSKSMPLVRGPILPKFLGPDEGARPGRLYAKVLRDERGRSPAPFWRADPSSLRDTRLRPGESDTQTWLFPKGTDRIRIRLVHRRFWKTVVEEKRWPNDEEAIVEREIQVRSP